MPIIRAARGQAGLHQNGRVTLLDLPAPEYEGNGVRRVANMSTFALRASRVKPSPGLKRPDVVIGSSVHPLAAWAGLRQARRLGVPFIFEVRDLWPQTLVDFGQLSPSHPVAKALWRLESQLCNAASAIISPLENIDEYLASRGLPTGAVWIPNGIDVASRPVAPPPRTPHKTLMYLGAHGQANNLDLLIEAIAILEHQGVTPDELHVVLYGQGPLKPALQRRTETLGLRCIEFHDPVPSADVPTVAAHADAFVLPVLDLPQLYRYGVSPNKLYEYMAAGRPTIITLKAASSVADADSAWCVDPTPTAVGGAVRDILNSPPPRLVEMGRNARAHVSGKHDHSVLAQRLAETLGGLPGSSRREIPRR